MVCSRCTISRHRALNNTTHDAMSINTLRGLAFIGRTCTSGLGGLHISCRLHSSQPPISVASTWQTGQVTLESWTISGYTSRPIFHSCKEQNSHLDVISFPAAGGSGGGAPSNRLQVGTSSPSRQWSPSASPKMEVATGGDVAQSELFQENHSLSQKLLVQTSQQ